MKIPIGIAVVLLIVTPAVICLSLAKRDVVARMPANSSTTNVSSAPETTIIPTTIEPTPTRDQDTTAKSESSSTVDEVLIIPQLVVVQDDSGLMHVKSKENKNLLDTDVQWLIITKKTNINKVEETVNDPFDNKNRKVISEDIYEELKVYRDDQHQVFKNGIEVSDAITV